MQDCASAFYGRPDFLPTTARLLCKNPHSGQNCLLPAGGGEKEFLRFRCRIFLPAMDALNLTMTFAGNIRDNPVFAADDVSLLQ